MSSAPHSASDGEEPCVATIGAGGLVVYEGRILLVQTNYGKFRGHWMLPGGLVQAGEHPREGVVREVFEETGVSVRCEELLALRFRNVGEESTLANLYLVFRCLLDPMPKAEPFLRWPPEELQAARFWEPTAALSSDEVRPQTKHYIGLGQRACGGLPLKDMKHIFDDSLYSG